MITRLNVASIWVLDKDEALDFYVNKLGLEKGNDVRQGNYRWLTNHGDVELDLHHGFQGAGRCNSDSATQGSCSASPNFVTNGAAEPRIGDYVQVEVTQAFPNSLLGKIV